MPSPAEQLAAAGFIAAEEEAAELHAAAAGDPDVAGALLARRLTGEPLAWITGRTVFCGRELRIDPGVYVPRAQSEPLARRAAELLPAGGTAIDLCTGCGAIAAVVGAVGTDLDPRAVACARANGVEAYEGDLFGPLPPGLTADVIVGVLPYVPTPELGLLQRDTLLHESPLAYDGGEDGLDLVRRVLEEAPRRLRPGGALLLELGGDQAERLGLADAELLEDEDGQVRGVVVRLK